MQHNGAGLPRPATVAPHALQNVTRRHPFPNTTLALHGTCGGKTLRGLNSNAVWPSCAFNSHMAWESGSVCPQRTSSVHAWCIQSAAISI